jgi:ribonuclease P/MRP protein subunit POP5
MKHLPKHLRPRWRYLAVQFETSPTPAFDRRDLQSALWDAAQGLFGDTGSAALDLRVLRFRLAGQRATAVVRSRRGQEDQARAVLGSLRRVGDTTVRPRVRGISGTVRACEEKYIGGPPEPPEQRDVVFEDAEREAVVRDGAVDIRTATGYMGATTLDIE